MKTLFILFASTFISVSANASLGIKSIELNDSTIISGADVSAITLNNGDSSVNSIETLNGDLINGSEIKLINLFRPKIGGKVLGSGLMSTKHGGDDSGG